MRKPRPEAPHGDDWNDSYGAPAPRSVVTDDGKAPLLLDARGRPLRRPVGFQLPQPKERPR